MESCCIVIPTYNEKKNIMMLLKNFENCLEKTKNYKINILIVDANSPDGTKYYLKKIMKKNKDVKLLLEVKKEGLGKAYLKGFEYASRNDFDFIITMDADLSHDPNYIPKLLEKISSGWDLVIGSRYVSDGGIENWTLDRILISKFGNFFARKIAGIKDIKDCTSGYRCFRTSLYNKIDRENIKYNDYSFLTAFLSESQKNDAKIIEIPIIFKDRIYGETKLKKNQFLDFIRTCLKIRIKKILNLEL